MLSTAGCGHKRFSPRAILPVALLSFSVGAVLSLPARSQAVAPPQLAPGGIATQNQRNERQIIQQSENPLQGPAVAPVPRAETPIPPEGGQTFLLKGVTFDPSFFITKEELDALAQPYVGKKVDIAQIQRLVKAVNDIYAARGIVTASAVLPPQDLKNGVLRISLIEGKLGNVSIKGNDRLRTDFVRGQIKTESGEVVDVPALTRSVGAFNKTGVAQVQASLQPGASFGLTDLQLSVIEPPAVQVQVFSDNQGVEAVNKYEAGFLIQGYAPLGIDDRLTLYGVGSQGNLSGNIGYSLPFDLTGGRIGASYTKGKIYVVQGAASTLAIKGRSDSAAVNAVQPIFVNANWFVLGNAGFTQSLSRSTQTDIPITNNQTLKETVGFSVGYNDETFAFSIAPSYSAAQTSFALTGTRQTFNLYNGNFAGSLRLPEDFLVTLGGAFQVSSSSLIAGDQLFQIGGPTTVRGYMNSFAAGASGYYANLELHHDLNFITPGLAAFVFYDRGSVYSTTPTVTLNSVGAGLTYDIQKRLLAEVSLGVPLNHPLTSLPPLEAYFRLTFKFNSADFAAFN